MVILLKMEYINWSNIYFEFDNIINDIGFNELQRNILEQKDIITLILFSEYINLKCKISYEIAKLVYNCLK